METVNLTWFNACSFQKILRNVELDGSIEVSDLTIEPATSNGDNYTSDIYRVSVEYFQVRNGDKLREKRSFILKVAPHNNCREEMILGLGIFETELLILSNELPKMNEILAKLPLAPLSAQCLYVHHEMPLHIIVEDLVPKGFRLAEWQLGLGREHCILAIRNLGRYHAASIALNEKVDFQVCHWGSPAEDILYFLGSSPAEDVRIQQRELLLRKYHSSLTSTMAELQCATEAPSLNDLKEILQKRAFHEVLASIEIIPFMTLETGKHINLADNLSSNEEYRNPGLSGKAFRKIITRLLPFYDSMGLLDA